MLRRYCDDCFRRKTDALAECDQAGQYLAELKADGYRAHVEFTPDGPTVWSRRWKKHPVSTAMLALLEKTYHFVPKGTIFDGEWLKIRTSGPETLMLWDVMFWKGKWIGTRPLIERRKFLIGTPNVWEKHDPEDFESLEEPILTLAHSTSKDFEAYFKWSKRLPWTEGVVLKKMDSTLVGSIKDRTVNPAWIKVKWRDGCDGHTVIA